MKYGGSRYHWWIVLLSSLLLLLVWFNLKQLIGLQAELASNYQLVDYINQQSLALYQPEGMVATAPPPPARGAVQAQVRQQIMSWQARWQHLKSPTGISSATVQQVIIPQLRLPLSALTQEQSLIRQQLTVYQVNLLAIVTGLMLIWLYLIYRNQLQQRQISKLVKLAQFTVQGPWPVLRIDHQARLLYGNPASKKLLKRLKAVPGQTMPEPYGSKFVSVLKNNRRRQFKLKLKYQIFRFYCVPVPAEQTVNIYAEDITLAEHANVMKSEFVSLASHQLRTPLTAIRWISERLLNPKPGPLTDKQAELVKLLHQSSLKMIHLVNDLLNISRLDSGRMTIDPQPTDLRQLVAEVIQGFERDLAQKQIKLEFRATQSVPRSLRIDPQLIRQAVLNLISNAIKYTPEKGKITVYLTRRQDEIVIQISDTGYGIPAEEQHKVFEKFYRATNVATKDIDGTGLGLYLVQAIVKASGGRLELESEVGQGTTFRIILPRSGSKQKRGEVKLAEQTTSL